MPGLTRRGIMFSITGPALNFPLLRRRSVPIKAIRTTIGRIAR